MLRKFLFARLSAGDTAAAGRIYPVTAPQGKARPLIIYQETGSGSIYSARGGVGVARARVQITAIAATPEAADDLFEQIRVLLHGFKGSAGGVIVQHCLLVDGSKRDVPYVAPGNEEQTEFGKAGDFNLFHVEPIP